jgi:hypothetical protein
MTVSLKRRNTTKRSASHSPPATCSGVQPPAQKHLGPSSTAKPPIVTREQIEQAQRGEGHMHQ